MQQRFSAQLIRTHEHLFCWNEHYEIRQKYHKHKSSIIISLLKRIHAVAITTAHSESALPPPFISPPPLFLALSPIQLFSQPPPGSASYSSFITDSGKQGGEAGCQPPLTVQTIPSVEEESCRAGSVKIARALTLQGRTDAIEREMRESFAERATHFSNSIP